MNEGMGVMARRSAVGFGLRPFDLRSRSETPDHRDRSGQEQTGEQPRRSSPTDPEGEARQGEP